MLVLSRTLIVLLMIFSFVLRSSALPLPEQNAVLTSEAAPLEADDDPTRLKRYQSLGLRQRSVQRVQLAVNVHPDAGPALSTPSVTSMAANPTGAVQGNAGASAVYFRKGGIPAPQTGAASFGEELSRTHRPGLVDVPLSDQSATQVGTVPDGPNVSETVEVGGSGKFMASTGKGSQAPLQAGSFPSAREIPIATRESSTFPQVSDSTAAEHVARSPLDASSVASSTRGAGVEATSLQEVAAVRQAIPEVEQRNSQVPNVNAVNIAGLMAAQGEEFNDKGTSTLQFGDKVDGNGVPALRQRAPVSAATAGSVGYGEYTAHQTTDGPVAGSYV